MKLLDTNVNPICNKMKKNYFMSKNFIVFTFIYTLSPRIFIVEIAKKKLTAIEIEQLFALK
jgi:hypothetical protein